MILVIDLKRWGAIFDRAGKELRIEQIKQKESDPDFWNDQENAKLLSKEKSGLETLISRVKDLESRLLDVEASFELIDEVEVGSDDYDQILLECVKGLDVGEEKLTDLELERMLSGKHDRENAILEINSGAGGTEAQDWGEMLLRMYSRWAEKRGFKYEILSYNEGEGAGIKSATLYIEGDNAFGFLRSERGVHRLVRISPFDANARRHTSFASVSVMPDIEDDVSIEIRDEDLRIDTFRASGAGGQHVNKTDSAVRLTHIPTGIAVACQSDRSQHKNKATAMKLLKAKLYEIELEKREQELSKIAGERKKIDFGSQIRSYVLQPYQMIKDTRTGEESGNTQAVLDGEIDQFIRSYLMSEYNIS